MLTCGNIKHPLWYFNSAALLGSLKLTPQHHHALLENGLEYDDLAAVPRMPWISNFS